MLLAGLWLAGRLAMLGAPETILGAAIDVAFLALFAGIVGREIDARPKLLIVSQPTWGVDVGAAAQIRGELLALRDAGCALLVVSEELDELFEISDRLVVIAQGRLSPPVATGDATREMIGEWMSGLWEGSHAEA